MTDTLEFLGLPITGEIYGDNTRANQRPLEEFSPILQAVLDDPTIIEFGWSQYTPYFNDGEACIFSVRGPVWFRTDADADADVDDLDIDYDHPSLGDKPRQWTGTKYVELAYSGPDEDRYDRCHALNKALQGGEFDDVLQNAFGDHADVTVRKDGISVEHCSHD